MNQTDRFVVLDPTEGSAASDSVAAARLSTLDGKVLAVVNNGKRNSDVLLAGLLEQVKQQYNLKDVLWVDKTNASLPIPDETLQRLRSADAVIAGVGD